MLKKVLNSYVLVTCGLLSLLMEFKNESPGLILPDPTMIWDKNGNPIANPDPITIPAPACRIENEAPDYITAAFYWQQYSGERTPIYVIPNMAASLPAKVGETIAPFDSTVVNYIYPHLIYIGSYVAFRGMSGGAFLPSTNSSDGPLLDQNSRIIMSADCLAKHMANKSFIIEEIEVRPWTSAYRGWATNPGSIVVNVGVTQQSQVGDMHNNSAYTLFMEKSSVVVGDAITGDENTSAFVGKTNFLYNAQTSIVFTLPDNNTFNDNSASPTPVHIRLKVKKQVSPIYQFS